MTVTRSRNSPWKHLSWLEITDMLDKLARDPRKLGHFKGYEELHNWTHICGLWELPPDVKVLILIHNIGAMHL
jgi:hypothetical protein